MYFRYGSYEHPQNEVLLRSYEQIPRFSRRGLRMETLYRMTVEGELLYDTQATLATQIANLIDVYTYDHRSAELLHDDRTPTRHVLLQNDPDNMSGVRIIKRSWPYGRPAEYATTRTFSITMGAIFRELESQITEWREQVQSIGTGEQWRKWITVQSGQPRLQIIAQRSPQTILQYGVAVGYDGWPELRIPSPLYPQWLIPTRSRLWRVGPVFRGLQYSEYIMRWFYMMISPVAQDAIPNQF